MTETDAQVAKREESAIIELVQSLGIDFAPFIVDIGGNMNADVSTPFAEKGWRVLIVEPQPPCVESLRNKFAGYEKVSIEACGCSFEAGELSLHLGKDGLGSEVSTFSDHVDPWMDVARSENSITVPVKTLDELLAKHDFPNQIGILKIDTEAWDYNVLRGLDLTRYRPSVVITEEYLWDHDATLSKHELLEEHGYVNLGFIGMNSIWVHHDHGARWSALALRQWLAAVGRYPRAMGDPARTLIGEPVN